MRDARTARSLDQAELGRALGLERSLIAKIESGSRRVTAVELLRLSDALDVPMGWLVREAGQQVVSRREAAVGDSGHEDTGFDLDVALEEWTADVLQIWELGLLPPAERRPAAAAAGSVAEAQARARDLRAELGWGQGPLGPMADVAAACGVWLWSVDAPGEGASLAVQPSLGTAVVSAQSDPGRRRFTAAHEIGHHVLSDAYAVGVGVAAPRREREAIVDAFAGELLLPVRRVAEALSVPEVEVRPALVSLAVTYRVSWSVVVRAVRLTKTDWDDRRPPTRAEMLMSAGHAPPEDLEVGSTAAAWQRAVLAALDSDRITPARALEMLRGEWVEADLSKAGETSQALD